MSHTVLLVDDEPNVTEALKRALHRGPYMVLTANSARQALEMLEREPVDVIVSDEMMPGMLGSELLSVAYKQYPDTIRILLTGHVNLEVALRAINEGHIYRFLIKPCNELELSVTIRQAIQHKELAEKSRKLLREVKHQHSILRRLEQNHPGITRVERDCGGAIVIDDDDNRDLDSLIDQMHKELEECKTLDAGHSGEK